MKSLLTGLGCVGMVLSMWGIIWGIFLRGFVWLAFVGLIMMAIASFGLEEK